MFNQSKTNKPTNNPSLFLFIYFVFNGFRVKNQLINQSSSGQELHLYEIAM